MVVFDNSLREVKLQKNRGYKLTKTFKVRFGEYAFVASNESKMELIHLTILKKFIKKIIKQNKKRKDKDKKVLKNYKIWMCIVPNFVISRKSKNARMGKGKGGFIRWVFRIQKGVVLTEFLGISYYRLIKILSFFRKVFKLKLCLVRNSEKRNTFSIWSKLNTSLIYFDKYRYM